MDLNEIHFTRNVIYADLLRGWVCRSVEETENAYIIWMWRLFGSGDLEDDNGD
jgi:hypothetical protein